MKKETKNRNIERRKKQIDYSLFGIIMLLIGFILGTHLAPQYVENTIIYTKHPVVGDNSVSLLIPAIDSRGNGVVGYLHTTVKPGTGLVLVNINNLVAQPDTQISGRVAAEVARQYSKVDLSNYDIIYSIDVNATVIEGPSAGAAMAVSVIAAIKNKTLTPGVVISGVINKDGTIGPVGGIAEKARVSKEHGAKTFLISRGQLRQTEAQKVRECKTVRDIEYCEIKYIEKPVNFNNSLGINILEVKNIEEAMKYFTNEV